jgi:hypothetical protein
VEAVCDIVHLGVNSSKQHAARAAAALLKAVLLPATGGISLSPGQALDLLYTALDRHQYEQFGPDFPSMSVLGSVVDSLRDSNSLDAVSTAQLMPVLQHAVQLDAIALRSATRSSHAENVIG